MLYMALASIEVSLVCLRGIINYFDCRTPSPYITARRTFIIGDNNDTNALVCHESAKMKTASCKVVNGV